MTERIETTCCIAGGGPAGIMAGFLLARAGVEVVVLEKHADFLRDFRGDTIHPSTMEIMADLGLLDAFLKLPHQRVPTLAANFGDERLEVADFSRLDVRAPFVAMMPQWDFLDFLVDRGRDQAGFRLIMEGDVVDVIEEEGRVAGVRAETPNGPIEVRAVLTIGADGRGSKVREAVDLPLMDFGAPMDVLWFRLSRVKGDTDQTQGRFDAGRIFIMLNRGDYWQCAFVIPKGSIETVKAEGLDAFRDALRRLLPVPPERADEIADWEQVKLLTVEVNRLKTWWAPGVLFIGDAAHAMSPVGGVGVNLAVQDAVAAANILARPLREGTLTTDDLAAVQRRREWPTRVIQRLQVTLQKRVISNALASKGTIKPPFFLKVLTKIPLLRDIPARLVGLGIRPEHPDPDLFG